VLLTLAAGTVARADAGIQSMSLSEALDYARSRHPQIKSALAEWNARKAEARIPRAGWMPFVAGTTQIIYGSTNNTTNEFLGGAVQMPRIGGIAATTSTNWNGFGSTLMGISVRQQVYDFGLIAAQTAIADAYADVAHAAADAVDLDIQLSVEEAYAAVLSSKEVLRATEDALKRTTTHRDFAQAGTRTGMRPPIDLTRAEADVAAAEVRRVRADAGVRASRAALAASIGSDALEIDAQPLPSDQSASPAFDDAMRAAAAKNPAIFAAMSRLRAQQAITREVIREMLPNLWASGGLNGRAGGAGSAVPYGDGWLPSIGNWHLGLVLEWRIFDGATLARRDASRAREEAMKAEVDLQKMLVGLGVHKTWLDLDAALRAVPGLQQSVDAARANLAQAEARFRGGLGTIVELADAENLLINAQLDLAVGQFAVARSRAELARAMGQPTRKQK
jgi:outer membrane protein TolC